MNTKDTELVYNTVESEGFDYTFTDYSSFKEIKDKEFHRLRQAYLDAREALAAYIGVDVD